MNIIFIILCCSIVIILLIVLFHYRLQNPSCGADEPLNNMSYCDNGKIIRQSVPASCDAPIQSLYINNFIQFIDYVETIYRQQPSDLYNSMVHLFKEGNVYKGLLLFAIPPLLYILSSDFGNNASTPYGILSFFDPYLSCVSKKSQFCSGLTSSDKFDTLCMQYLQKKQGTCPFIVNDSNTNVLIKDYNSFNYLGAIGSISLDYNQAIVLQGELPVKDLALDYWSFNLYLTDSFNKDVICQPYRQLYAASIASPLNMFTAVAASGKKFNPLTGENCLKPGYVQFYLVISLDDHVTQRILQSLPKEKVDFIHVFKVPAVQKSMIIDDTLPNPNYLVPSSTMFNPATDRLGLFLRLSPNPQQTTSQQNNFKDFIMQTQISFQVCLVQDTATANKSLYAFDTYPPILPPPLNEKQNLSTEFHQLEQSLENSMTNRGYDYGKMDTRNSLLNIMAPLYKNILNSTIPYQGGWQAIQMAGNAQADNHDANYFFSTGQCLRENDIFIALSVNHSYFNNALYNSVNLLDTNKAFGYDAISINNKSPYKYYIVLASRSDFVLNITEKNLQQDLGKKNVSIHKIYIRTGSSNLGDIPLCHIITMIERTYLNTQYIYQDHIYNIKDVFGEDLQGLDISGTTEEHWDGLKNITACDPTTLIHTNFYKATYMDPNKIKSRIVFVIMIVFIIVVVMGGYIYASF